MSPSYVDVRLTEDEARALIDPEPYASWVPDWQANPNEESAREKLRTALSTVSGTIPGVLNGGERE